MWADCLVHPNPCPDLWASCPALWGIRGFAFACLAQMRGWVAQVHGRLAQMHGLVAPHSFTDYSLTVMRHTSLNAVDYSRSWYRFSQPAKPFGQRVLPLSISVLSFIYTSHSCDVSLFGKTQRFGEFDVCHGEESWHIYSK